MADEVNVTIVEGSQPSVVTAVNEITLVRIQESVVTTDPYIIVEVSGAEDKVFLQEPEEYTVVTSLGEVGPQGPPGPQGPQGPQGIQGPPGSGSGLSYKFSVALDSSHLAYEVQPGVISIALPVGQSFSGATTLMGFVDGIHQEPGRGWQPSTDGSKLEIYLPTDPGTRSRRLAAEMLYTVLWS